MNAKVSPKLIPYDKYSIAHGDTASYIPGGFLNMAYVVRSLPKTLTMQGRTLHSMSHKLKYMAMREKEKQFL